MQRHYDKELGEVIVPPGACPYPIGDDDGTAKQCVQRGHCGCDESARKEALARGTPEQETAADLADQ